MMFCGLVIRFHLLKNVFKQHEILMANFSHNMIHYCIQIFALKFELAMEVYNCLFIQTSFILKSYATFLNIFNLFSASHVLKIFL